MGCQASLGVSLKPTLPVTLHYISELYTSYLKNRFLNIVYHLTKPKSFLGGVRGLLVLACISHSDRSHKFNTVLTTSVKLFLRHVMTGVIQDQHV